MSLANQISKTRMDKTTVLLHNVKQILIEFQVEVTKTNVINDDFL